MISHDFSVLPGEEGDDLGDGEDLEDSISYLKPTRPTPAQTKVLEELSITTERQNALLEKQKRPD